MNRLLVLLTVLITFAMVAVDVTAAEGDDQPAGQMEEVNLDEETADLEEEDFDDFEDF